MGEERPRPPRGARPVDGVEVDAQARVVDTAAEPELAAEVRARSEAKYGWGDGLIVEVSPGA